MMNVSMITVGNVEMSKVAFTIVVVGVIIAISITVVAPRLWYIGILALIAYLVAAYKINCIIVGRCYAFAWVMAAAYIIYPISITAIVIMYKLKNYASPNKRLTW